MPRPRALTWVTCFTYASVLTAAWFAALTHTAPTTPLPLSTLTLTLLTLAVLDLRSARLPNPIAATLRRSRRYEHPGPAEPSSAATGSAYPVADSAAHHLSRRPSHGLLRRYLGRTASSPTDGVTDLPAQDGPIVNGSPEESSALVVAARPRGIRMSRDLVRAGRFAAVAGVGAHAGLFAVAAAADAAGDAKILFVLLPFEAFVALGRWAAIGVAAMILAVVATSIALQAHTRTDAARLAEFVMFSIGVVFAVALGALATRAEHGQRRAEELLAELSESHARLREYADQAAGLAAAAERARVARDIHDTAGHHLAVVAIQLEKAAAYRSLDAAAADQALADARDSARAALEQVRTAVGTLRADTDGFTLSAALSALANRLGGSGFPVRVDIDGNDEPGESAAFALYLAAQEGLTNAFRHSGAAAATVRVEHRSAHSVLEIADGGRGFAPGTAEGNGLTGMRERLTLLGGQLRVDTGPHGTRLRARLPRSTR